MIWLLSLVWSQPKIEDKIQFNEQWRVVHMDPQEVEVLLVGREENKRSVQGVWSWSIEQGMRPFAVMNGGMFHQNHTPVGLYIDNKGLWTSLELKEGNGNFFMRPNGVLVVDRQGIPAIVKSVDIHHDDYRLATQSGPLLLHKGKIHPKFRIDSPHQKIRNGVGVTREGVMIWVVSLTPVCFYDLARVFISLGCDDALYLDGTVSTLKTSDTTYGKIDAVLGPMLLAVQVERRIEESQ